MYTKAEEASIVQRPKWKKPEEAALPASGL